MLKRFKDTLVYSVLLLKIVVIYLIIRNPDFPFFNFLINLPDNLLVLLSFRKSFVFLIIGSGFFEKPLSNCIFLFVL